MRLITDRWRFISFCSLALCSATSLSLRVPIFGFVQDQLAKHPPLEEKPCLECHRAVFEGASVHSAGEDDLCRPCHPLEGKEDGLTVGTHDTREICLGCHEVMYELMSERSVHIIPENQCSKCHDPHASTQPKLLAMPMVPLCGTCHEWVSELETAPVSHGPVLDPGCLTCHEPHASPHPSLLRAEVNELCLACHGEPRKESDEDENGKESVFQVAREQVEKSRKIFLSRDRTSGHPMLGHPVTGTTQTERGEIHLDCAGCHLPHLSERPKLVRGSMDEICTPCHF